MPPGGYSRAWQNCSDVVAGSAACGRDRGSARGLRPPQRFQPVSYVRHRGRRPGSARWLRRRTEYARRESDPRRRHERAPLAWTRAGRRAGEPDVRVSGRDTERVSLIGSPWPAYSGYHWRRRWGYWRPYRFGSWGPYYGDVWTRRFIEGALTVDVVERQTGALVYRAVVTDELGKDLDKQVAKSVEKAFKKFPVKELDDR